MVVQSISALAAATQEALDKVLGQSSVRGSIGTVQNDGYTMHQVNLVCEFSGRLSGLVIFGMSLNTADRIASCMTGEQIVTFDAQVSGVITDLCTEILECAMQEMSEAGISCEVMGPRVVRGTRINLRSTEGTRIVIPFTVREGEVCATITLREAA